MFYWAYVCEEDGQAGRIFCAIHGCLKGPANVEPYSWPKDKQSSSQSNIKAHVTGANHRVPEGIFPNGETFAPGNAGSKDIRIFSQESDQDSLKEQFQAAVMRLIIGQNLSFNLLASVEFENVIDIASKCGPAAVNHILTPTGFVKGSLAREAASIGQSITTSLKMISHFSLMTDMWAKFMQSYTGVNLVTCDPVNFDRKIISLGVVRFDDKRHTAENVASKVVEMVDKYSAFCKVFAVCTDGASNNNGFVKHMGASEFKVTCAEHLLNTSMKKILHNPTAKQLIGKVRKHGKVFRRSDVLVLELRKQQCLRPPFKVAQLKTMIDIRFSSIFIMLRSFEHQYDNIHATLEQLRKDKAAKSLAGHRILDTDHENIAKLTAALKLVYDVSVHFERRSLLLSDVVYKIWDLKQELLSLQQAGNSFAGTLLTAIMTQFAHYFGPTHPAALTCLIDPRFRHLVMFPSVEITSEAGVKTKVSARALIHEAFKSAALKFHLDSDATIIDSRASQRQPPPLSVSGEAETEVHDPRMKLPADDVEESTLAEAIDKEVGQWIKMQEDPPAVNSDPLVYWSRIPVNQFPLIRPFAAVLFTVPPTSLECENNFSATGRIMVPSRNKIGPLTFGKMTLVLFNDPELMKARRERSLPKTLLAERKHKATMQVHRNNASAAAARSQSQGTIAPAAAAGKIYLRHFKGFDLTLQVVDEPEPNTIAAQEFSDDSASDSSLEGNSASDDDDDQQIDDGEQVSSDQAASGTQRKSTREIKKPQWHAHYNWESKE